MMSIRTAVLAGLTVVFCGTVVGYEEEAKTGARVFGGSTTVDRGSRKKAEIGDMVNLFLTGEAGKEYARLAGLKIANGGNRMVLFARIINVSNGRITIEDSSYFKNEGKAERHVRLKAELDEAVVTSTAGDPVSLYKFIFDAKTTIPMSHLAPFRVELSETKGINMTAYLAIDEINSD